MCFENSFPTIAMLMYTQQLWIEKILNVQKGFNALKTHGKWQLVMTRKWWETYILCQFLICSHSFVIWWYMKCIVHKCVTNVLLCFDTLVIDFTQTINKDVIAFYLCILKNKSHPCYCPRLMDGHCVDFGCTHPIDGLFWSLPIYLLGFFPK